MLTLSLILSALALAGGLAALWQRAEARAARAGEAHARARANALELDALGAKRDHEDRVARLEGVILDLGADAREKDDEIDALLSDDPARAGTRLRRVLSAVPGASDPDPVLPPPAGSGGDGGRGRGGRN